MLKYLGFLMILAAGIVVDTCLWAAGFACGTRICGLMDGDTFLFPVWGAGLMMACLVKVFNTIFYSQKTRVDAASDAEAVVSIFETYINKISVAAIVWICVAVISQV
jgi:hypothetical protein